MSSYTPNQLDDANLAYHYKIIVNDSRGVYYQLSTGAQGFPAGFWASERYTKLITISNSKSNLAQLPGLTIANRQQLGAYGRQQLACAQFKLSPIPFKRYDCEQEASLCCYVP
jgi:hypothetical protein